MAVVKSFLLLVLPAPQLLLLFDWQIKNPLAIFAAAALKFVMAIFALDKQQMTRPVFAIPVRVAFLSALMAIADYITRYLFAEPIVKNKILAFKFIFQIFLFDLTSIFDNSAFEMKNLCKTVVH